MEWWREARFGLFIHWGLYAQPAGEWEGEQIPGISEPRSLVTVTRKTDRD